MEKVKLTEKQAKAIEAGLKTYQPAGLVNEHASKKISRRGYALYDLDLDTLIRALYIGYEVETEFKVDDWVVHDSSKDIGKIKRTNENGTIHCDNTMGGNPSHFRHATLDEIEEEKERRWWTKHGRDVWELKQGDILMGSHRELYEVTADPKSHRFGCYTGNDSRDFDIKECKRDNWRVVCFDEDRKDV